MHSMKAQDDSRITLDKASVFDPARSWTAVIQRNRRFDGHFVYAVTSTRIYCRPSCPSRRPRREHAMFFRMPDLAEQAGYRACRRCDPRSAVSLTERRVQHVRRYLEAHFDTPVTLKTLAREVGMSPCHLQRTFKQFIGVSPKAYADAHRIEHFKTCLKRGDNVSTSIYDAGYGSSSRLYARSNSELGMTPVAYQRGGRGILMAFTTADSPLGLLLVAKTERGVAAVIFGDDEATLEAALRREYPTATIMRDAVALSEWVAAILGHLSGERPEVSMPLDVQATAFQRRVWQALQAIPYGSTRSYSQLAMAIDRPKAVRAVAHACATNPVALVVPCHRAIREDGGLGGYRWGLERKKRLLALETDAVLPGTRPTRG